MKITSICSTCCSSARRHLAGAALKLFLMLTCLFIPPAVLAEQVSIDFDNLQTGAWHVEDGYLFSGNFSADWNFYSSPSLRIYGNSRMTISRVDGETFSLDGLNVLYRQDDGWFIEDENHFGFHFSRAGEYVTGQYMPIRNVHQLTIGNSAFDSWSYSVFDQILLSNNYTVSEPSTLSSMLAAFVFMVVARSSARHSRNRKGLV